MSFSSDEINFLIYRYLLESHFYHSARTFGAETGVDRLDYDGSRVQAAALLELLRKGIWYTEAQISIDDSGRFRQLKKGLKLSDAVIPEKYELKRAKILQRCAIDVEKNNHFDPDEENVDFLCHVKLMKIQEFNICTCVWNPAKNFLVFGSRNSLVQLWNFDKPEDPMMLLNDNTDDHSKKKFAVTTLDWSPDGTLLAAGFSDGLGKVWKVDGTTLSTLELHTSVIISIKWNRKQSFILTASADYTTAVWEGISGKLKQQFAFHGDVVLDADWQSDEIFASSSVDRCIHVCKIGQHSPLRTFVGHEGEINEIKWDPYGRILASCSDDKSIRLWSIHSETCIFNLLGHTKEVHSISWGHPTLSEDSSCKKIFLVSASFDGTVRLWEPQSGTCLLVFRAHTSSVYSVAFSPDGCFFATASSDQYIFVLDIESSSVIYSYKSISGIVKVCWNYRGDIITGISEDGSVCILHLQNFVDE